MAPEELEVAEMAKGAVP
jgi:hypothetical protein